MATHPEFRAWHSKARQARKRNTNIKDTANRLQRFADSWTALFAAWAIVATLTLWALS